MKKFFVGTLAIIGALTIALCVMLIVILSYGKPSSYPLKTPTILTIEISSPLAENNHSADLAALLGGKPMALKDIINAIDRAKEDPFVVALVLRLDHANIGMAQAQEIRDAVIRFRNANPDAPKMTIAFADSYGEASGTIPYYIATACQEIWLQPTGGLGLTGLYAEMPFARKAIDSLKLKPQMGRRKEYKSVLESFTNEDYSPEAREALEAVLESLMLQLTEDIGKARNLEPMTVRSLIDQAPFLTQEALEKGLVDKLGYFDEIKKRLNDTISTKEELPMISSLKYLKRNPLPEASSGQPKIALIFGEGNIHRDRSHKIDPFGNLSMGAREISYAFKKATDDEDVKAIVLRINSGGGSAVASESILRALIQAKASGRPVIVSMSNMTASGGYWIAAFADKIVAHPATLTGSIGVAGGKMVTQEFWKQWGVNWNHVQIGENAGMWSSSEEFSEKGWERFNASLDATYEAFLERVSKGRNMTREQAEIVAKGRVWSGQDALTNGLVDTLGGMHEAVNLAKKEAGLVDIDVAIEVFPPTLTFMQQVFKLLDPQADDESVSVGVMPVIFASLMQTLVASGHWLKTSETQTLKTNIAIQG